MHDLADEAAEVTLAAAAEEAVALADAGDTEGADEVLVEAAIEAAVMEETADEIAEELIAEAAVKESGRSSRRSAPTIRSAVPATGTSCTPTPATRTR